MSRFQRLQLYAIQIHVEFDPRNKSVTESFQEKQRKTVTLHKVHILPV